MIQYIFSVQSFHAYHNKYAHVLLSGSSSCKTDYIRSTVPDIFNTCPPFPPSGGFIFFINCESCFINCHADGFRNDFHSFFSWYGFLIYPFTIDFYLTDNIHHSTSCFMVCMTGCLCENKSFLCSILPSCVFLVLSIFI